MSFSIRIIIFVFLFFCQSSFCQTSWDPLNLSGGAEDLDNTLEKAIANFDKVLDDAINQADVNLDERIKQFHSGNEKNLGYFNTIIKDWNGDFNKTLVEFNDRFEKNAINLADKVTYQTLFEAFLFSVLRTLLGFILSLILLIVIYCLFKKWSFFKFFKSREAVRVFLVAVIMGIIISILFIYPSYNSLNSIINNYEDDFAEGYNKFQCEKMLEASKNLRFFNSRSNDYKFLLAKSNVIYEIFSNPFLKNSTTKSRLIQKISNIEENYTLDSDLLILREYIEMQFSNNKLNRLASAINCTKILKNKKEKSPLDFLAYDIITNYLFDPIPDYIIKKLDDSIIENIFRFNKNNLFTTEDIKIYLPMAKSICEEYEGSFDQLEIPSNLKKILVFNRYFRITHAKLSSKYIESIFRKEKSIISKSLDDLNNELAEINNYFNESGHAESVKSDFRFYDWNDAFIIRLDLLNEFQNNKIVHNSSLERIYTPQKYEDVEKFIDKKGLSAFDDIEYKRDHPKFKELYAKYKNRRLHHNIDVYMATFDRNKILPLIKDSNFDNKYKGIPLTEFKKTLLNRIFNKYKIKNSRSEKLLRTQMKSSIIYFDNKLSYFQTSLYEFIDNLNHSRANTIIENSIQLGLIYSHENSQQTFLDFLLNLGTLIELGFEESQIAKIYEKIDELLKTKMNNTNDFRSLFESDLNFR